MNKEKELKARFDRLFQEILAFGRELGEDAAIDRIVSAAKTPKSAETAPNPANDTSDQRKPDVEYGAKKTAVRQIIIDHPKGTTKHEIARLATDKMGVPMTVAQVEEALRKLSKDEEAKYAQNRWFPGPKLQSAAPKEEARRATAH